MTFPESAIGVYIHVPPVTMNYTNRQRVRSALNTAGIPERVMEKVESSQ